ncbi:hypothetical protein [Thermobifida cellulosilytica]|uniref:hypothetical protein n=1 Tax=Thermobifida cellulosilytica TaxID=144786 RepID=UPI000A99E6B6|nr:hypothetical protein [Thermobifida cellulosilytica]
MLRGMAAVDYWADDVAEAGRRLLEMGAAPYQGITSHGEAGFVTASVLDPLSATSWA